jgi:hypothetical protein
MRALKAGLLYFALVFAAGFVLGPIRILWLVPRVGQRAAELIEMPFMLVVIVLAARWTVRRLTVPPRAAARLTMGCIAAVLLLLVEFTVVLWLQGASLADYLAKRDPIAAAAYYLSVGFFALAPLLIAHAGRRRA